MSLKASTLRPGLLVSLHTSCRGNVSYRARDIEREHRLANGKMKAKWETERTIDDPEEYEKAREVQSQASNLVRAVCAKSAFGLLCPESAADELDDAIKQARQIADEFNDSSSITKVHVYVIVGRIAADDVEAMRAINSEVRELLDQMQSGVKNLDVEQIRTAANKAKQIGSMLTPEAETRMVMAINAVRSAARKIVKAGEEAAGEVDRVALRRIKDARTMFLDLDDVGEIQAPRATGRAIDLESVEG